MAAQVQLSNVLIVEDNEPLRLILAELTGTLGCQISTAETGAQGIRMARELRPDLVLLDLGLPDVQGMSVCREIIAMNGPRVIVITAVDDANVAEQAIGLGADDYVRKPFHLNELAARIRGVLRRCHPEQSESLKTGRLTLDPDRCQVTVDGRLLTLSATELRLLEFFMRHPGWVFSKERLLESLWPDDRDCHAVQVHIFNLRRKIELDPSNPRYIITVKGLGYKLASSIDNETP